MNETNDVIVGWQLLEDHSFFSEAFGRAFIGRINYLNKKFNRMEELYFQSHMFTTLAMDCRDNEAKAPTPQELVVVVHLVELYPIAFHVFEF